MAIGWSERDVTPDLKGALIAVSRTNFAAIREPKELAVLRAIHAYNGDILAVSALKLIPLLFVRPASCAPQRDANLISMVLRRIPA